MAQATAQLDLADPVLVVGLAGEGAASLAARLADRPEPADTSSPTPCEITRHDDGANGVVYLALSTALSTARQLRRTFSQPAAPSGATGMLKSWP